MYLTAEEQRQSTPLRISLSLWLNEALLKISFCQNALLLNGPFLWEDVTLR